MAGGLRPASSSLGAGVGRRVWRSRPVAGIEPRPAARKSVTGGDRVIGDRVHDIGRIDETEEALSFHDEDAMDAVVSHVCGSVLD